MKLSRYARYILDLAISNEPDIQGVLHSVHSLEEGVSKSRLNFTQERVFAALRHLDTEGCITYNGSASYFRLEDKGLNYKEYRWGDRKSRIGNWLAGFCSGVGISVVAALIIQAILE